MPGILLEWISVTPVSVARLWQGCWMQTSNHNLQAQATLPCKSQLGKILFQRFCRILWLAGRTISHRPCTECGLENTLCIHCFCLGSSFIVPSLCPFSCDEMKVDLLEKNCFFPTSYVYSWNQSPEPPLKVPSDTAQAEPRTQCSAGLLALLSQNIPTAFLARSPFLVSLPHLALLCLTVSQRLLLLKEGSCISPATSYTAAFTASGSQQGL